MAFTARAAFIAVLAATAAWAAARARPPERVEAGAPATAPARLSETGLYGPDGRVNARNLAFAPQYPLWTDGAEKARWILVPPGKKIDVSDIAAWNFPVGTKLWKEFAFAGRKVETRMIWRAGENEWVFATYVWNDEQTDAELAPPEGLREHAEFAPGRRHSIPSVGDCRSCHESAPTPVLGFNALQLSDDRDPLAPHAEPLRPGMVTLATLNEKDLLEPRRPDLATRPPRIEARSARERAVLGYLAANCGHCHNTSGPLARLGVVLAHDPALPGRQAAEAVTASVVGVKGRYLVPGVAEDDSRLVAAGAPDHSALAYRMRSRRPSSQMPPVGTVVADEQAVDLVRAWIADLGAPRAQADASRAAARRR